MSRNEDRKSVDWKGLACNQSHFLSLRRQQLPAQKSPTWEGHWLPAWREKVAQEEAVGSGQWAVSSSSLTRGRRSGR